MSLVFDRKVNRRTPGPFRTRVIADGVVPSLHVDYKKTRIKQYHKEGQALRTETTINDTRDFAIGRRIENLKQLRKIGFVANRRLLDVQRIGHDCFIGEASFQDVQRPITVNDQRAAALRFADPRVQARARGSRREAIGGPPRRPGPGHELVEARGWPEIDEFCEHVGEVGCNRPIAAALRAVG